MKPFLLRTAALLVAAGPVTALPLLFFSGAVTRIPLTLVGLLQYITPVLQFLVGLLIRGEAMSTSRWVGFALIWAALVVLTLDGLTQARAHRSRVRAAPARA